MHIKNNTVISNYKISDIFGLERLEKYEVFTKLTKKFFIKNPKIDDLCKHGIGEEDLNLLIHGKIDGFTVNRLKEILLILDVFEDNINAQ